MLPNKMSELIDLALDELRKIEKNKNYVVNMDHWHGPDFETGKCQVCFAGAVMAGTLKKKINSILTPSDFRDSVASKLHALNSIRTGDIQDAYRDINREVPNGIAHDIKVADYEEKPEQFKKDMEKISWLLYYAGD